MNGGIHYGLIKKRIMEKFARRCDVTGRGMSCGWVWEGGSFYTSTEDITLEEFRIAINRGEYVYLNRTKAELLRMSDYELMSFGYDNNIFYYTEWYEIDDDYYYDAEGNEYEV